MHMDALNFPKLRMFKITGLYHHTLVKGTAGYVSCVPYTDMPRCGFILFYFIVRYC